MRRRQWGAVVVAAAVVVAGCGGGEERDAATSSVGSEIDGEREPDTGGGWLDDGSFESAEASSGAAAGEEYASDADRMAPVPSTMAPSDAATGTGTDGTAPSADVGLRAGWVDDNERWDDYLLYRQQFDTLGLTVSPIVVEGRQVITVRDGDGRPVLGAKVEVLDAADDVVATLRTYADGRTLFHAPTEVDPDSQSRPSYHLRVSRGDVVATAALDADATEHEVTLDASTTGDVEVDVMFLIDTTGSMGDEIARLQANITSVAEQLDGLEGDPDVRFGMTVYRDRGDTFVTRTFDFTGAVDEFASALDEVTADGGGDVPEDMNAGLHDALTKPAWRGDDTVKLLFLVADAPPHLDYDGPDYADDVRAAAEQGVKIVPIASSGLDPQGEYVFRQLAQVTMGTFVFLTYGADGVSPGDDTPHQVDDYSVLALDELVVRFVAEELGNQA